MSSVSLVNFPSRQRLATNIHTETSIAPFLDERSHTVAEYEHEKVHGNLTASSSHHKHHFPACHLAHESQADLGSHIDRPKCGSHIAAMELVKKPRSCPA